MKKMTSQAQMKRNALRTDRQWERYEWERYGLGCLALLMLGMIIAAVPASASLLDESHPYVSFNLGANRSEGIRFVDGKDTGEAVLYGNERTFDAGRVDTGLAFGFVLGLQTQHNLRAQLEIGAAHGLDYRGGSNYARSGDPQPSEAGLDTWHFLVAGYYDFSGWALPSGRKLQPFVGVGLGALDYTLDNYAQRFPAPDDPTGYLRRGPGGEVPFTALPKGSDRNFSWMLTAGVVLPIRERLTFEFSYRYNDAGEIATDAGNISIVRFREDGSRREIQVPINETSSDYRFHSLCLTLRFAL